MILGFNIFPDSVVVITDGQTYNLTSDSHRFYDKIRAALRDDDNEAAEALLDVTAHVQEFVDDRLAVVDGLIQFEGRSIGTKMSEYMFQMMDEGFTVDPLVAFLENLRLNPSLRAVTELYSFLNANALPLTEDGHFLAYKFVNEDYMDCHTGTIDNSVGAKPSMPRNEVDENKDVTCSEGLHFCSLDYLKGGWGERWMIVKINPRDVVSIPSDYKNTKGRACLYEVIAELDRPDREEREEFDGAFDSVVDKTFDTEAGQLGAEHGTADYDKRKRNRKGVDYAWNPRAPKHYDDAAGSEYRDAYNTGITFGQSQ